MIEEILALGISHVELGYDLTLDLVPGVTAMADRKTVRVVSVHNFCPVPVGAPRGSPELFSLVSLDPGMRGSAVRHTAETVRFAADVGAGVVVVHAGHVSMKHLTDRLVAMQEEQGGEDDRRYEKIKLKLFMEREKKAKRHVEALYRSVEDLMPLLGELKVRLGFENLPFWEAVPNEVETEVLLGHFGSRALCYWHDFGHGQVRQNLGFIGHVRWLERLKPVLGGVHVHDVKYPAFDHIMPPGGSIDFGRFKGILNADTPVVFEPHPRVSAGEILEGVRHISQTWA